MTRNVRTYGHFCAVARTLERVGDRWSLLVIRDLVTGPKRFTDLLDRLGGITPKTLTQRLRELADAGIVVADRQPGRREVWYRLTPAGAELEPVIDLLNSWGLRHAWRWPRPDEPLHAEHLLRSAIQAIDAGTDDGEGARWEFCLDGAGYRVDSDGRRWTVSTEAPSAPSAPLAPSARADVTVTASTRSLAALIFAGSDDGVDIAGDASAVARFRRLIGTMASAVESG